MLPERRRAEGWDSQPRGDSRTAGRPMTQPDYKIRICSAPGSFGRLGVSSMVARDFSSLAVGAERNADASHISLPVTAPQNLPEPQHQDNNASRACTVASWSQDWDEAENSSRRTMREGSQSPPGHPLPLIPSSP